MMTIENHYKTKRISLLFLFLASFISCQTQSDHSSKEAQEKTYPSLPILGEKDVDYLADGTTDTVYHTIPKFYFTAHDSSEVTSENVAGKIYVADFFFTNCPTICPVMTMNLKTFHENTADIEELIILSHTIDPRRDTLAQLNRYIEERNIDTRDDWFFLYNSQEYTYDLGKYGYLINADVDPEAEGGFLHSEHFVLIDREGRIRGMYEGTNMEQVNQLEKDIRDLIKYEYGE